MAIQAPLSRYKRNNFYIYMVVCLVAASWFAYDGYLNKAFIAKHTDEQGRPTGTLVTNRVAPPFLVAGAVLLGGYLYAIRNRKIVAAEDALVIAGKQRISYDAIEKIDRTHFEKRGFFTITYKSEQGSMAQRTLSDREYDNLGPILDHLVVQIS
jgi:hypothetical protein